MRKHTDLLLGLLDMTACGGVCQGAGGSAYVAIDGAWPNLEEAPSLSCLILYLLIPSNTDKQRGRIFQPTPHMI